MKYSLSYSTWNHAAIEAGDTDNRGWEIEETEYHAGVLRALVACYGFFEPSDTDINDNTYFYSIDNQEDYRTGEVTEYCLHLKGVSISTKRRISKYLSDGYF